MYRKVFNMLSLVLVLAMAFSVVAPVSAQPRFDSDEPQVEESPNGIYIVQMIQAPAVSYEGDIPGLNATKPNDGEKLDRNNSAVKEYVRHLEDEHDGALRESGGDKLYDYGYTFNGFAAQLTVEQANKLVKVNGVLQVSPDALQTMDTSSTTSFLGLDAKKGLWSQLGGPDDAGEGVVIGIIDSGVWPESLSFADRFNKKTNQWTFDSGKHIDLEYKAPKNWTAPCVLDNATCNNKLIGAQYYNTGYGGDAGIAANLPWEFLSARDYNAHGTHTASTAGGNFGVQVTGPAASLGKISGMAPHAYISVYKALWSTQSGSQASGYNSDLVAAIDQAVADGVDVINYSVSGSLTNFLDPVEIAFLNAADAGVFVAASAGNSGPTASTVAHPSPWITTVAAGTHNRSISGGSVTLGNGTTYNGSGYLLTAGPLPLIDAATNGLAGADPATLELCYGTADDGVARLDPAMVAGKIVVCNRGGNVLVNKARAVKDAGGAGMVLVNTPTSANTTPFVAYVIPAVHLTVDAYAPIKAYATTAGATATIHAANVSYTTPAPFTASFSSRGPLLAGNGDLLKPDVIAPGQDILAAVSPAIGGLDFDLFSGTSMSSPHVAGIAALLKDLHPKWSPMMIKSALMTSGYDVLDGPNTDPSVIFSQGAGHIRPNSAADPGLVYDSSFYDWVAFLCGTTSGVDPAFCSALAGAGYSLDPSNLNVPSISIGDMAGAQTVNRTVKNVGEKEKYTFSYTGLAGITVTPSVNSFTIDKNKSKSYSVTFTTNGAALNAYTGGYITWTSNKGHVVRIPVVIQPVAMAAPSEVSGSYDVTFGYTGPFSATASGLVPATSFSDSINTGDFLTYGVTVPAGATFARFSIFDAETTPGSDLDLYVFDGGGNLVGQSAGGTADEEVNLVDPVAGDYTIGIDGFGTSNPSTFTVYAWVLDGTDAGNMTVGAPASATSGTTETITLTFSGLTPGVKYLGAVVYGGAAGMPDPTIVRVDP